ncbi:cytochrome b/b6 domain-containing protein [Phenylobacterium aquaticum]|uniref:cytochrome b/b6 domain-containing protein n=1 Tax=Phenylobacterium aquaticum TaxID=1763816 RepID=UPI001F5D3D12|nr:cytochrome b/b6 domain-containing protein [Phenylobacterium aquaticum]MCI3133294.1 cytochrome b/b6 domain-containing protein [Phenylobacterium aquaticum]
MTGPVAPPRRWDPLVRLTHWGVAAAIVVNGLITEEGSQWHVWVGLAAGALLALRLAWGLIGPPEARFTAFPPSPAAAVRHVRDILAGRRTSHRSHNPLGALMVYAVWATLAVVVGTGVAMTGFPPAPRAHEAGEVAGRPEANREAEGGEEEHEGEDEGIGEIHEVAANLLFVLAAVHLAGVAFETRRSGRQVVTAMLGGGDAPKDA